MRQSIFDLVGNLDTLLAVAVGAVLATSGALFAELVQDRLNRKRRERDAARFFGEVMTSLDRILAAAVRSQTLGDPWGPVTHRLFRTALREAEVYERNRERLFDIRDMGLRTRIHTHMVVKTFPVSSMIEYCDQLETIEDALLANESEIEPARLKKLKSRAETLHESLDRALDALKNEMQKTEGVCTDLEKIARVRFSDIAEAGANNAEAAADAAADPDADAR